MPDHAADHVPAATDRRPRAVLSGWADSWRRRPFLPLVVITVVVAATLVVIVRTTEAVDGDVLWPELTKALISVLTVAVLGGLVKFLLDQYARERDERRFETEFIIQSIADLEGVRSDIEHSRFLIAAHRSARSYRDQMQNVIALRVRVAELQRRIEMHWQGMGADVPRDVIDRFDAMARYLADLAREYQEHYKPISDVQRIDEVVVTEQIKTYAEAAAGRTGHSDGRPEFTWRAWDLLNDPSTFPCLNDFIDMTTGSRYERQIRPHCRLIVNFLTNALSAVLASRSITTARLQEAYQAAGSAQGDVPEPVERRPLEVA